MPRVNFREVKDRFNVDSDNRFVSCDVRVPGPGGAYRIGVYPWWEHPLYIESVEKGEADQWEVVLDSADEVVVSIYPIGVHRIHIGVGEEIWGGWRFVEDDLIQLEFEDSSNIICNQPMSFAEWEPIGLAIDERVKSRYHSLPDEFSYVNLGTIREYGRSTSFVLGTFPYSIFQMVKSALTESGVQIFISREPEPKVLPVALLIGDDGGRGSQYDYIIADDFEVEFPEIIHKPEWYVRKSG